MCFFFYFARCNQLYAPTSALMAAGVSDPIVVHASTALMDAVVKLVGTDFGLLLFPQRNEPRFDCHCAV